jgi:hypothetical protein
MTFGTLLRGAEILSQTGDLNVEISGIEYDSRRIGA